MLVDLMWIDLCVCTCVLRVHCVCLRMCATCMYIECQKFMFGIDVCFYGCVSLFMGVYPFYGCVSPVQGHVHVHFWMYICDVSSTHLNVVQLHCPFIL